MGEDIDFTQELEGNIKYSYEQFHMLALILQQRIMVSKGSFPVREAMLDHQWYSVPEMNKEKFIGEWETACLEKPSKHDNDKKREEIIYKRICEKTQIISNLLLSIKVINYAPPNEAAKIIQAGVDSLMRKMGGELDEEE